MHPLQNILTFQNFQMYLLNVRRYEALKETVKHKIFHLHWESL